jgi:RNA polymerase sigma-70 factor (ECF subfamily)
VVGDLELLHKAAGGDAEAFEALVERHGQRLYALAVSLVGSAVDAEDVLQETLAGAFRGLRGFQGRSSVKTWLTRILLTQAAKWLRDRKRRKFVPLSPSLGVASDTGLVERSIDLHAALQRLSAEHREVLVLREFDQMGYEEMAQVLDVPRGTVESRLHRARAALREMLDAYRV